MSLEETPTIENTRIPRGSNRLRPTGKCARRLVSLHFTNLLVVQTIKVQRRSNAESSREAISEREDEKKTAAIFEAKRKTFAMILI
jgi:hypothetical protein